MRGEYVLFDATQNTDAFASNGRDTLGVHRDLKTIRLKWNNIGKLMK